MEPADTGVRRRPIILDASRSACASEYFVSLELSDIWWNRYGGEYGQWLTGADFSKYGNSDSFDLKRWAEDHYFAFVPGQYYRVKLGVGPPWNEHTKLISIDKPAINLKINGSSEDTIDIVGPDFRIMMDGASSSCAGGYFLSVQLSDAQWNRYGHEAMKWLTSEDFKQYGPIQAFDVKRFAESQWVTFVPGQHYRVKLAVGPDWTEKTVLIRIKAMQAVEPGYMPPLRVLAHIQGLGDIVGADAEWVGPRGQSRRLEGFEVKFSPVVPDLGLEYMAHLANRGDTAFVSASQFVGSRGEARRLEGFAARLTGINASRYEVFYQCHIAGIGDSPVLTAGQFCGTRGQSRRIEALRIWIVAK